MTIDRAKSLAELGGEIGFDGPSEGGFKSGLVSRCEALYSKPLEEYSPGDLRVMIGQHIALQYLVPMALEVLSRDPLVEGDYCPGDLLAAVLGCGRAHPYDGFWDENPLLNARLEELVKRLRTVPDEIEDLVQRFKTRKGLISAARDQARRKRRRTQ